MLPHALLLILCATPALASDPMSAADFETYTTGKTLYFGPPGAPYGAEQYLTNRRVIWSFLDGTCQEGHWYPQGSLICFTYNDLPGPQCWRFFDSPEGLTARFENAPEASKLIATQQNHDPLTCPGPDIGV